MLSGLKKIFSPPAYQAEAYQAYAQIVAAARQPFFYAECEVPDTFDGRFDMVLLHLQLVIARLQHEPGSEMFVRALQEAFFADMDRGLREMGVGDTGVGKRVKNMAQAFYGRLQTYGQAAGDVAMLEGALRRNLYREAAVGGQSVRRVAEYILRSAELLRMQPAADIISGKVRFQPS